MIADPLPDWLDREAWQALRIRLMELFIYDPDTGEFSRRKQVSGARKKREVIGYRVLRIDGRRYMAHRLAWLYMTGEWPEERIDHKDRDTNNCRFDNLRKATQQQNMWNSVHPAGASGMRCVYKVGNKYRARTHVNRKGIHLGYFNSPELAAEAVANAVSEMRGEFANTEAACRS